MTITTTPVRADGGTRYLVRLALGVLGLAAALAAAPAALAEPASPETPTIVAADTDATPPASAQSAPVAPAAAPQASPADPAAPPAGVPHLTSPENLPPGTTGEAPQQSRGMGYLRDLLHAVRTQDVTMNDALLLLTQRPMDARATPPPGMSAGPSGPVGSSAGVAPVPPTEAPAPTE